MPVGVKSSRGMREAPVQQGASSGQSPCHCPGPPAPPSLQDVGTNNILVDAGGCMVFADFGYSWKKGEPSRWGGAGRGGAGRGGAGRGGAAAAGLLQTGVLPKRRLSCSTFCTRRFQFSSAAKAWRHRMQKLCTLACCLAVQLRAGGHASLPLLPQVQRLAQREGRSDGDDAGGCGRAGAVEGKPHAA